ncbi:hypothetical protein Esti_000646 [Eimeria stiedai]
MNLSRPLWLQLSLLLLLLLQHGTLGTAPAAVAAAAAQAALRVGVASLYLLVRAAGEAKLSLESPVIYQQLQGPASCSPEEHAVRPAQGLSRRGDSEKPQFEEAGKTGCRLAEAIHGLGSAAREALDGYLLRCARVHAAAMAGGTLEAAARCQQVLQCLSTGVYCPLPRGYLDLSKHGKQAEEEQGIGDPSCASSLAPQVTLQWPEQLAEALRGDTLAGFSGTLNISGHQQLGDKELLNLLQAIRASRSVTGLLLRDTGIGDNSVRLLSLLLKEVPSFACLDLAGTRVSEAGVVELCLAARRQKSLQRLCLPCIGLAGLEAVVTLVRRNRALEELEVAVHNAPPPLTAASRGGLVDPEERGDPKGGPSRPPPFQPKGSSKEKGRQMIRVPNEQEDEALSLTDGGEEETLGSPSDAVERLRRCRYVEELKRLLLKLFAAYEEARGLRLLSVGGLGDDPRLHSLVLAFDQLSSVRQLAREKQLASEKQLVAEQQLASNLQQGGPSPVPLRLYFSNMLEGPLTQALVALAKAKADSPETVDSGSKELAFLAKQLYEAC